MELIQPTKQEVWGWTGVVNFALGGMGAGFYLLSSVATILQSGISGLSQPVWFKLLPPVLISLGFLTLTIEAGRPLRGRYLLRHLRRSWMSRETLAGAVFIPAAVLDWFFPHPALWALAAAAAIGLMISHGCIVYRVRAVAAWNVPPVPLLFLTSGFTMGGGLMLLAALGRLTLRAGPVAIALICVVLDMAVWFLYLRWPHDVAFREATEPLRRPSSLILTVGVGHVLPVLLLLVLLAAPGAGIGTGPWAVAAALAGLAMVAGGVSQKASIILKAGYLRGIALGRLKGDEWGVNPAYPLSSPAIHQG